MKYEPQQLPGRRSAWMMVAAISVILCGNIFAQEQQFVPAPPPEELALPAGAENTAIFAQAVHGGGIRVQGPPPAPSGPPPPGIPQGPEPGGRFSSQLAGIVQRGPENGPGIPFGEPAKRTLLVGFTKLDQATRQNIQEDMQIMSRLLDKATEHAMENGQDRRMGIVVMALPGAHGENIYLEDYGPLFILNVPIPLAGPQKMEPGKNEEENSDWEQTKRELYQNRPFGAFEPMKYDAQKVEALKKKLLEALKNATNIRHVKPDQSITVVITGGENARAAFAKKIVKKHEGEPSKEESRHEVFEGKGSGSHATTLTIRVKKSDVDAFAKGKMDLEEFAKKAAISSN